MTEGRGYTLIEMLVVVAILGILTMTGVVSFLRYGATRRVDAASIDVALALRGVRAKAILDQQASMVSFDPVAGVWSAPNLKLHSLPPGVQFTRPDSGLSITFSPPGAPGETTASFNAAGLLQSTVRPAAAYVGIPSEGLYRRIRVNLLGQVEVNRWTGSAWN